ncbi:MAG: alpha/beta hydrolase [Thermoleophilia bacterium]|nr:alpha/beta hydrolase [Thermoleophilia bacterium]
MTTDAARWRAPALGEAKELDLSAGKLLYHDVGNGPTLVFVHGLLVNANLWRKLVERLSAEFRCVVLDLPIGSHILPREPGADNGPVAVANLAADAIDALGLEDVTLIGNDSGGAMSQVIVTTRPERIGRLVLTSCDFRDNFPPKLFAYFKPTAAIPGALYLLAQSLRIRPMRRLPIAFGWLTKRPIEREAEDSYLLPAMTSGAVREDTRKFIKGSDVSITNAAADRLGEFRKPAMIAWSTEDKAFPPADGEALAKALPDSRLEWVDDAYTFSMEDNPDRLAELIRDFVR